MRSLLIHLRPQVAAATSATAAVLVLSACGGAVQGSRDAPLPTGDAGLGPGDAIELRIWREPDLSGTYQVDDRGIVTLPLLGERPVAGVAPVDLRSDLLGEYREYLQNPSIEVTVLRRINILGAVQRPGLYPVDETISLSEALALAGGLTPVAAPDDIRLIRSGGVLSRSLDETASLAAVQVRSGDRIVVGEKSWLDRNSGALLGSLIAAAAVITTALIR